MKRLNLRSMICVLTLAVLLSACSGPAENGGSSNTNAPATQANSNSAQTAQVDQSNAPAVSSPPAVQPIPPADTPAAARNSNTANSSATPNPRGPKLVAPDKKIDYGKQPQDKTMVRTIVIKNGGLADLNIESVVPS